MKKIDYNQFTKSDLPLDTYFQSPETARYRNFSSAKPKITAIGKSTSDKVKNHQRLKSNKSKLDVSVPLETMNEAELEKLNDDTIKNYSYRARRNRTIIIILIILLSLSLLAFGVFFAVTELGANCYINVHGNIDCSTYVDGQKLSSFRTPTNVQGNRIFEFNTDLEINAQGSFKVSYTLKVYQNNVLLENTQVIKQNSNFVYNATTKRYESQENISGGKRVDLLEGVTLDWEYEKSLNVNNFKLELNIYIIRA